MPQSSREYISFRDVMMTVRMDLEYADIPVRQAYQMMSQALVDLVTPEIRARISENERLDSLAQILRMREEK